MIEGAGERPLRRGGGGAAWFSIGSGAVSFGLLENMAAGLYEGARIADLVVEPDFVMNMRSGGAAGGPDPSQRCALGDLHADLHGNGGEVAIAGVHPEAVIHFHHIAIVAAIAGENHRARRGGGD